MVADEVWLNDAWQVYAHEPSGSDWTLPSYKLVGNPLSTVSDFWTMFNSVEPCLERSMLFIMRDGVTPSWDDPACIDGALVSAAVVSTQAKASFKQLVQSLLGETLLAGGEGYTWSDVLGVSMGPKKAHCVIKIWMGKTASAPPQFHLPSAITPTDLRVTPSRDYIQTASAKR